MFQLGSLFRRWEVEWTVLWWRKFLGFCGGLGREVREKGGLWEARLRRRWE